MALVADLGISKVLDSSDTIDRYKTLDTFGGTKVWLAPEIDKEKMSSEKGIKIDLTKTDIFSLGLISFYCLDKEFPTDKRWNDEEELVKYVENFQAKEKLNSGFYFLLRCMVSFNVMTRPSIKQIYNTLGGFDRKSLQKVKNLILKLCILMRI